MITEDATLNFISTRVSGTGFSAFRFTPVSIEVPVPVPFAFPAPVPASGFSIRPVVSVVGVVAVVSVVSVVRVVCVVNVVGVVGVVSVVAVVGVVSLVAVVSVVGVVDVVDVVAVVAVVAADKGWGGGGGGHPDPDIRRGASLQKFFSALRTSFWSKNKGRRIRHFRHPNQIFLSNGKHRYDLACFSTTPGDHAGALESCGCVKIVLLVKNGLRWARSGSIWVLIIFMFAVTR